MLVESIKNSLIEQSREQGKVLIITPNGAYNLGKSLEWTDSIEGCLFWNILYNSFKYNKTYDYITITHLYHIYGESIFKLVFNVKDVYRYQFDKDKKRLTEKGFNKLCKYLEENGATRKS